jgi:hypothetical protein
MNKQQLDAPVQPNDFADQLLSQLKEQQQTIDNLERQEVELRQKYEEKLRGISEEREKAKMVIRHLNALLALQGHPQTEIQPSLLATTGEGTANKSNGTASIADMAYQLLKETGKEYHYKELAEALIDRGVHIPGSNPASSLVARIHDDPRLIRPRRGVYALKESYPANTSSVGTRRTKRRKARRKPKSNSLRSTVQ